MTYLVLFEAIFENVLHDQTSGLAQRDFVPHALKSLVDVLHDLGRGLCPAKLEQLLPDVTSISVNHGLGDASQEFMDHNCFVVLWHRVKSLLHNVTAERVHREIQGVSSNSLGNLDDLLWCAMFKAALNEKVAKPVHHQGVGLGHDCFDNLVLLLGCADFELLLKENRCLLIIIANDLVHNVLPVTIDIAIQESSIVQWLSRRQICWTPIGSNQLRALAQIHTMGPIINLPRLSTLPWR